jgi:pyruvate/2-oxoglutarate dehydrogenase complex dihydrolipoamide acyltransferase (E2) component
MVALSTRRRTALLVGPLLVVLLGGCAGGSSAGKSPSPPQASSTGAAPQAAAAVPQSTICSDVDALQQSVANLKAVPLEVRSLPQVQTIADQMKQQLSALVTDSKGQYEQQIAPVQTAAGNLQAAVSAARQSPNTATLAAVRAKASDLGSALQGLKSSIGKGC